MECKMGSFLYEDPATHEDGKSLALAKHSFAVAQLWSERPTSQQHPKKDQNTTKTKTVKATGR